MLAETDFANFKLKCLVRFAKIFDLHVDYRQTRWFWRRNLEDCLCPGSFAVFAVVLEHLVLSFPTMFYWAVVPGHEGDRIPCLVPGIHVGHGVLAVEGDGLLS